jgi:ComF family protein
MSYSLFAEILRDFLAMIYPNCCAGCAGALVKGETFICTRCASQMPQTNYHNHINNPLRNRLVSRMNVSYAMALFKFSKSGRVQHVLHALKYKNQPELGVVLGNLYGDRLTEGGLRNAFELIIPVPLHAARKRKRGYNQSAKFAEGLSQVLAIPFSDEIMQRKIKTETQTRKSKLNRWQNVSEVFEVKNLEAVRQKNILLVDDVVTTGATLEAAGHCLFQAGCSSLSIACIAEA